MRETIPVNMDHFGLISQRSELEQVFFDLGFTAETGRKKPVVGADGKHPGSSYFVFDHAYFDCTHSTSPFFDFLLGKCGGTGMCYFEFASRDIQAAYDNLRAHGIATCEVNISSRYADHGEKKGEAVFACTTPDEVLPIHVMYGGVEHRTPELFYDNERYLHDNSAFRLDEVVMLCDSQKICDETKELIKIIQPDDTPVRPDGGIRKLTLLSREEAVKEYGLDLPEKTDNTAGIRLYVKDASIIRALAERAGYPTHLCESTLVIDLLAPVNLFLLVNEAKT